MKASETDECVNQEKYQSAVGSLLYLSTRTRPDIAYAVGNTARFSSNPTQSHWTAIKRTMRYLNGTRNLGLTYKHNKNSELLGYSDADWAGDLCGRKSTSGYIFLLSDAAISWRSKKQTCVALSTAEAEYMALAIAIQEAIWLRQLISYLQKPKAELVKPITIFEDNQSAICIAKKPSISWKNKAY